jgi:hypothetical protein
MMSNNGSGFDPIGIVVDWIDARRERKLSALVELYDDAATVDCCKGGRFSGRADVERYWRSKLSAHTPDSFEIDAIMPEWKGVCLDYREHDDKPVRTHFRFSVAGKILHTACGPVDSNSSDMIGKRRAA